MTLTLTHLELQQAVAQWAFKKTGQKFMEDIAIFNRIIDDDGEILGYEAEIETTGDVV